MVMAAVMVVPANRMRTIFIFFGLSLFLVLFVAFRLARPERLVDPESFSTALVYLEALTRPSSVYLPSTWAYDAIFSALRGHSSISGFHLVLLFTGSGFLFCLSSLVAHAVYFKGFTRAQTASVRKRQKTPRDTTGTNLIRGPTRAFFLKELKSFFRDQTQWSQLFLIAGLIVIYLYNFKVLPIEKAPIRTVYLQNLLSFLNMGLAAFVLVAVSARFAFTAVSAEGEAFWLVKTAPVSLRSYLWIKFGIYLLPLWLMTEILIIATNLLLRVTPFMMVLSVTTMCVLVPAVTALAIGMGAAYPDFHSENVAQTVTSFGGLFFMILSAGYVASVILLEAGPVYTIFMAQLHGKTPSPASWMWIAGSLVLALIVSGITLFASMSFGVRGLEKAMDKS
jgi:ABC-2 type transport system permease protein